MLNNLLGIPRFSPPPGTGPTTGDVNLSVEAAMIPVNDRIDSLELAFAGLWRLMKERYGVTDQELIEAIQQVDAEDGQVDGKRKIGRAQCAECGRDALTRNGKRCSWCGALLNRAPI